MRHRRARRPGHARPRRHHHLTRPNTGEQVRIEFRGGRASWQPAAAAASFPADDGAGEDDRQAADVLCPTVNFYASAEAGRAYERAHGLHLEILTMPQAVRAAAATFGGLLEP
ncbi:MAG: hypothetical protein GEV03_14220 [Streptosporangiales bacterium]|nr:hypothetical protein [Streptosporangiales bacterium]